MIFKDKEIRDRLASIERKVDMIIVRQKVEKIKKTSKEVKKENV